VDRAGVMSMVHVLNPTFCGYKSFLVVRGRVEWNFTKIEGTIHGRQGLDIGGFAVLLNLLGNTEYGSFSQSQAATHGRWRHCKGWTLNILHLVGH